MSNETAFHDTFTIERRYESAPSRVFDAWADPVKKRRWYVEGEGFVIEAHEMDFREGGLETSRFRREGGPPMTFDSIYHDIVEDRRIVSSYGMTMDGKRFSVSLFTLEFERDGDGTLLRYTEQGAYFMDGEGSAAGRKTGCAEMLEKLARELGEGR